MSLFESFEWRFFERGEDEGEEKKKFGSSGSDFFMRWGRLWLRDCGAVARDVFLCLGRGDQPM